MFGLGVEVGGVLGGFADGAGLAPLALRAARLVVGWTGGGDRWLAPSWEKIDLPRGFSTDSAGVFRTASCEQLLDDMAAHIGQAEVAALVAEG